ncbi:MAG: hypothetical protein R3E97_23970 [Candidatus Eisenbacteria bacterium]
MTEGQARPSPHWTKRWKRQTRRALRFVLLAPLLLPLGYLPRSLARRIGAAYGHVARVSLPREVRRAERHLTIAFPDASPAERTRLLRETFVSIGLLAVDFLRIGRGKGEDLLRGLEVEGLEHLEASERSGRGTILVTAHFGNWELLAVYLARRGRTLHVLYHPFEEKRLERFVRRVRDRAGIRSVSADRPGPALRALRQGELVGVLVDRIPHGGVRCDFFGRECRTAEGAARLGLRTGALVLCAALWEDDSARYRARFWPPMELAELPKLPKGEEGPEGAEVERLSRHFTRWTEELVRMAPTRWPWFYDRWKVRPSR